jgi:hypothetical protein
LVVVTGADCQQVGSESVSESMAVLILLTFPLLIDGSLQLESMQVPVLENPLSISISFSSEKTTFQFIYLFSFCSQFLLNGCRKELVLEDSKQQRIWTNRTITEMAENM